MKLELKEKVFVACSRYCRYWPCCLSTKWVRDMGMITSENFHELIKLKKSDRDTFIRLIEEMTLSSMDVLLKYKKFKEYPSNV